MSYPALTSERVAQTHPTVVAEALAALRRTVDRGTAAALSLPLLLYTLTLAPTIYNLDSAELTTAAATGGLVRATGYPLYLALGWLWARLPIGDVGYRMNLLSAVCAALTLALAERVLRRLQVGSWARVGALGLLATAPYFWSMSIVAEVYTLHTALMAGVILLLLRWAEAPSPLRLALPVGLMVLSLGNHVATVLLAPAAVFFVLATHPRQLLEWRVVGAAVLGALAGAAIFLYLPLRHAAAPVFNYAGSYDAFGQFQPVNLQTLDGIVWLLSGQTFANVMFGYEVAEVGGEIVEFGRQLWTSFLAIGIGPGLLGLYIVLRRNWRLGLMLILMFAVNAVFYINYRVVDKNTMFLPAYLVWALWVGVGYAAVLAWFRAATPARWRPALILLPVLLVATVALAVTRNWRNVDLSDDWSVRRQSEAILEVVEPDAVVFGWWETVPGVQYLQLVEGRRPDVLAINRFLIDGDAMNAFIAREMPERPIYMANPPIYFTETMAVTRVGPVYRLEPRP